MYGPRTGSMISTSARAVYTGPRVRDATSDPVPGAADLSSWIGRVIDERYRIVEVLGEGGMGAVFVADHLRLRKQVALKIIRADFAAHMANFAADWLAHHIDEADMGYVQFARERPSGQP